MKVENKNAHRGRQTLLFCNSRSDGDGSGDDVVMLLLTDKELERASKRAEKNKKICQNILQSSRFKQAMKKLLNQDRLVSMIRVAETKEKSTGFFGWLMGD